ncbi:MAG: tRNA pseudouridine(38-40) synthase TruA [Actinomycetota bacterium]|nr:tRNA pseudouridine(38-40) synthase TruA [Actinomycetota bacterium]
MKKIKLVIEYDGGSYCGWQRQPNGLSIQQVLEEAIGQIAGGENISLASAGRTDAGVHAIGQVAAFETSSGVPPEKFSGALNVMLPNDIRILDASACALNFNPRHDAVKKTYFYLLSFGRRAPVFFDRYVWNRPRGLDLEALRETARHIVGRKDFSSFKASGCASTDQVRNVMEIKIDDICRTDFFGVETGGPFLKISVTADGFLRHMVRNIVGLLVEVGEGKRSAGEAPGIIECKDRTKSAPTAPARGLFLERVFYPE